MKRRTLLIWSVTIILFHAPNAFGAPRQEDAQAFLRQLIEKRTKSSHRLQKEPALRVGKDYLRHEEALQLVSENRLEEAVKLYENITLDNPSDDESYLLLGHACILTGKFQKAESAFASAVQLNLENASAILPFYENLVLSHPEDDQCFVFLGYAAWILQDTVKAKDAFREALRLNAQNSDAQKALEELRNR